MSQCPESIFVPTCVVHPWPSKSRGCFPYLQVSSPSPSVRVVCNIKVCDITLLITVWKKLSVSTQIFPLCLKKWHYLCILYLPKKNVISFYLTSIFSIFSFPFLLQWTFMQVAQPHGIVVSSCCAWLSSCNIISQFTHLLLNDVFLFLKAD